VNAVEGENLMDSILIYDVVFSKKESEPEDFSGMIDGSQNE
jgi:hypothetical protein